mgnify:CR=1 FL=1
MTDLKARILPGSGVIQRTLMQRAFSSDLLEQVVSRVNLQGHGNVFEPIRGLLALIK